MWRCSCHVESDDLHGREEQFCRFCGDARPYLPDGVQLARFQEIKCLVEAGRYSEQIEDAAP